jgi:hypothetical protein
MDADRRGGRAAFIASGTQAPKPVRSDVVALRPSVGGDRQHLERIMVLVALRAVRPLEILAIGSAKPWPHTRWRVPSLSRQAGP